MRPSWPNFKRLVHNTGPQPRGWGFLFTCPSSSKILYLQPMIQIDNYVSSHRRNCTVIALAAVTGLPYDQAHTIAKKAGRKDDRGFQSSKLIKYFNTKFGRNQFRKIKRSTITVQKFCKKYPEGRYFVRKRGHAYAIIDGCVWDKSDPKPLERIVEAWKFIGEVSRRPVENKADEN